LPEQLQCSGETVMQFEWPECQTLPSLYKMVAKLVWRHWSGCLCHSYDVMPKGQANSPPSLPILANQV